jgi:two-component system, NtrC family, response regulator
MMSADHTANAITGNLAQLPTRPLVIVCDNPRDIADFKKHLARDYRLHFAHTQAQALAYLDRYKPAVVLLDLALGRGTTTRPEGFLTMGELLRYAPAIKIIVVTETTQRADAVRAVGSGAYDFYHKPIEGQILRIITNRAYRWEELEQENRSLALQTLTTPASGIIGTCSAMQHVHKDIEAFGAGDTPVLIVGASGTGKKLVARALHNLGPRQPQNFVSIDCKTRPERALTDQLTDPAVNTTRDNKSRKHKSEHGLGGTLLLEDVDQLSPGMQTQLLDCLREWGHPADPRIVCTTHKDLAALVRKQRFSAELYALLTTNRIELPLLSERGDDRLLLARSFLHKFNAEYHQSRQGFSNSAIDAMLQHTWPDNVRELAQRIKRAVLMADAPLLNAADLDLASTTAHAPLRTLREARQEAESQVLRQALSLSKGNLSKAAQLLAISRPTLYDLLKRHELGID